MMTSGFTAIQTTRPNTTVEAPNDCVPTTSHSSEIGESATRGGATFADGSRATPTASNSLTSGGNGTAVSLIRSAFSSVHTDTTNCPVATALRSESLASTDVNCTTGGTADDTVKYECGARLSTPASE